MEESRKLKTIYLNSQYKIDSICAKLHSLSSGNMSEMFKSVMKRTALDWFLRSLKIEMDYSEIAYAVIQ